MEKKVQMEASPPQKMSQKELKKKKQNQRKKKKQDAGVKLDKDGFPIYDSSLFSSFDAPEWLDAEQEWGLGPAYYSNYGDRVTPFAPQWRSELPGATKLLERMRHRWPPCEHPIAPPHWSPLLRLSTLLPAPIYTGAKLLLRIFTLT
jgi:hypothetical protein